MHPTGSQSSFVEISYKTLKTTGVRCTAYVEMGGDQSDEQVPFHRRSLQVALHDPRNLQATWEIPNIRFVAQDYHWKNRSSRACLARPHQSHSNSPEV